MAKFMVPVLIITLLSSGKPEYLGIFWGGLFRESGESYGFLFQNNAHIKFPFNSRRVQNSPEAHDEPV